MITILMPWPPSVNAAWANRKTKPGKRSFGRIKTERYQNWRRLADTYLKTQITQGLTLPAEPLDGPVKLEIVAHPPDERKRDLSNIIKIPEDALVRWKVIEDDSQVEEIHVVKDRLRVVKGTICVSVMEAHAANDGGEP